MKNVFKNAFIEIIDLNTNDIITTSRVPGVGENDGEIDWEG